jgi:hypothetical protein
MLPVGLLMLALLVFFMLCVMRGLGRSPMTYSSTPFYMNRRYGPPWRNPATRTVIVQ